MSNGKSNSDKERTLEELKALREKRLSKGQTTAQGSKPDAVKPSRPPSQSKVVVESVDISEARSQDDDAVISAVRASRMQAEAYHDIARLRNKAQKHQAKAAKAMTRYKSYEAKTQKSLSVAVRYREKAADSRQKEKQQNVRLKELEKDLKATISGETEVTPEAVKLSMAKTEKKIAKAQEKARKFEAKAAEKNEKAALYKSKGAFFLEQSKVNEAEVKNYNKRADNLERASE